jgi:Fic family protein
MEASQLSRGRIERRIWQPSISIGASWRHRRPQEIACFVPDPIAAWDPPLTAATAALIGEADGEIRQLDREAPGLVGLEPLSRQLLRQESVGSSRIEGLSIGQRRLARAAAGIGRDNTATEIAGNVAAMEQAVRLAAEPRPVTREDLLAIHATLFASTRDARLGGAVRCEQNWIGRSAFSPAGAEFVPPPPEHVDDLLHDLAAFLNRDDLPVTLQAAIAHAQFETIHPFADGNGRVGRCLIHIINRRRGLAVNVVPPVSLVLATHSREYVDGLTEYRFGDPTRWLLFYAAATVKAVDRAHELGRRIEALREDWLERLGHPRRDASSRALAEQLAAEPIVTIARAAQLAGVSDTAAARAIVALGDARILTPVSKQAWGRRWEATEVFALLDDFERDLATPGDAARPVRAVPRGADR